VYSLEAPWKFFAGAPSDFQLLGGGTRCADVEILQGAFGSCVAIVAEPWMQLFVRVSSEDYSATGDVEVTLTLSPAPFTRPNDAFVDGVDLVLGVPVNGTTVTATSEPGEPQLEAPLALSKTVWYRFTPAGGDRLTVAVGYWGE
jgi:hypothetical protein